MDKNKKTTSNVLQTIETKDKILKKSYKYCKFRYVVLVFQGLTPFRNIEAKYPGSSEI